MLAAKNNNSKRKLLVVVGVFLLPVIIAKLALTFQWFNYGVTNHGELIDNAMTTEALGIKNQTYPEQWLLIYHLPQSCSAKCQQAMSTINSTFKLLGKEIPRVTPIYIVAKESAAVHRDMLTHPKWHRHIASDSIKATDAQSTIYIADPLGNLVMKHAFTGNSDEITQVGKAILADMKKLLKYSKIG